MKRLFYGGIHPADRKALSLGGPLTQAPAPKQVVLPMSQHIGAVCEPLVQVGERVLMGQKIGAGQGLCAPVHASVSGKVLAIEPRPHPNGKQILSVVIENDYQDEKYPCSAADWQSADAQTLIRAISDAGIVGMGGATFPTATKLRSGLSSSTASTAELLNAGMGKVDTVIINACECEPYITADDCLIAQDTIDVCEGARHLGRILKPRNIIIALEQNKPQAADLLRRVAPDGDVQVVQLPTRYPQGAEKQLIQSLTGREVPPGGLPMDVGCAVFNAATSAAVCRALEEGTPLYERIVTVTGEGVAKPQNFLVRLGTTFESLIEAAGGLKDGCERVISGGPMMGVAQTRLDVPVLKGTNAILCLTASQLDHTKHPACIRCGRCVAVCPMKLEPVYLHQFCEQGRAGQLKNARIMDCIECGCCAYVCPGKLPLVEEFRAGKASVRALEQEGTK